MDYSLLKSLTQVHSVTSDVVRIKNFVKETLKNLNVEFFEDGFGTIIAGKFTSEVMLTAHLDEVGFQVVKIEENGTIKILPIGDVSPNLLNNAVVYIQAEQKQIPGVIFSSNILRENNIEVFSDFFLDIGTTSRSETEALGIRAGQTGTYQKEFFIQNESIFASSLDNKISVFALLKIIESDPTFLDRVFIAFHIDEEMQNHSANSLTVQFKPEFAVNLDYFPVHQRPGDNDLFANTGEGSTIFYRGGYHIIHEEIRKRLDKLTDITRGFISSTTMQSLEPQNYENNGRTKAVNLNIPARGYHGGVYSVRMRDVEHFIESIKKVVDVLL